MLVPESYLVFRLYEVFLLLRVEYPSFHLFVSFAVHSLREDLEISLGDLHIEKERHSDRKRLQKEREGEEEQRDRVLIKGEEEGRQRTAPERSDIYIH